MVKGISRQVIVVHSPDPQLFDQVIFILKDDAVRNHITEEALLREAQKSIRAGRTFSKKPKLYLYGTFWSCIGALVKGMFWLTTYLL